MPTDQLFIAGNWRPPVSGATYATINPANEETSAQVGKGDERDVDLAVAAARKAFDSGPWPRMSASERGRIVWKLGDTRLPVQLPRILHDLDTIRGATTDGGSVLMLSSFVWLVAPGMVLDSARDVLIYRELNERYWPFSYAHMRRFVDFENRVFT
jgi:hypothetical protein